MNRALFLLLLLTGLAAPARAAVLMTHYNSFALLDSDGVTPLEGTSALGDFIQLVHAGLNGVPDTPDAYGAPGGDDLYLPLLTGSATTHVGDNEPGPNWNLGLYNDLVTFDDAYVGGPVFLRFWNGPLAASSTHYGETAVLNLPAAPMLGPAFLDFVPTAGSSRTASIPFAALASASVPEPSASVGLVCGLTLLAAVRRVRRQLHHIRRAAPLLAACGFGLTAAPESRAQLTAPLDVTASRAILGPAGLPLPGSSPDAALFALEAVPGALVQILAAGPNGAADLPAADGAPAGDDSLVAEVTVGRGIAPNDPAGGRFAWTVRGVPAPGTKLFARAFNAPTRAAATHWSQSAVFTFQPLAVMDVSRLGLLATTIPLGSDPALADSDGDGQTDLQELRANTSALDPADVLRLRSGGLPGVRVQAKAGRRYLLDRLDGDLSNPAGWQNVAATDRLPEGRDLMLADPQPPASATVIYRVRVQED